MIVTFFGHAAVGLVAERAPRPDFRVLIDPYEPMGFDGRMTYPAIAGRFTPDVVLVTHNHPDHAHTNPWPDAPVGTPQHAIDALPVEWTVCDHDGFGGQLRGGTTGVARFELDGLHIVHTGDLGELPDPETLARWRPCELLFVAAGGYYTLGASEVAELSRRLQPAATIPIHTRTPYCALPHMSGTEGLLARLPTVERREGTWRYSRPHRAGLVLMEPAV